MLGLSPASAVKARVLELGCGSGLNLLPQAEMFPKSEFVGCDLSQTAIDYGQALAKQIAVENIELHYADLQDVDEQWGRFDYIICHGVYSWVPPHVQSRILDICRANLAPQGVTFVSYNVLPGWNLRKPFRDLLSWHTKGSEDPDEAVMQALSVLAMVTESQDGKDEAFSKLVRDEYFLLSNNPAGYLCHEMLEKCNSPCYFTDFMAAADDASLQFLAEASFHQMYYRDLPETPAAFLDSQPLLAREQYLDFFVNRTFRETLLCHQEIQIDRSLSPESLTNLHVSFAVKTDTEQSKQPDDSVGNEKHQRIVTNRRYNSTARYCIAERMLAVHNRRR